MMSSLPHGLNSRLLSSGPKNVGASSENPSGISTSRPPHDVGLAELFLRPDEFAGKSEPLDEFDRRGLLRQE
jgi:hypothetical protein